MEERFKDLSDIHQSELTAVLEQQQIQSEQHLQDAITKLREDLTERYEEEMRNKLSEQEEEQYHEVLDTVMYLGGIESKVSDIYQLDRKARMSMNLWAAVNAINLSLIDTTASGRTRSLGGDFEVIRRGCSGDEVVSTILATVPESAMEGVMHANTLIEDFHNLKTLCKRVAMVNDESASILPYVFSFIKSLCVSTSLLQNTDDPDVLGPFGILERADLCVREGRLEEAARLMGHLKGVARKLVDEWLREVRLHVETKQSVDLLMAYAVGLNC